MTNPIQYTSRTFLTALADINSDPLLADKPDWIKRLVAGAVDVASVWENASVNNLYLRTAMTRRAVTDLCSLIDYTLTPKVTASGQLMFDIDSSASLPLTISKGDLAANGQSSINSSALRYGARSSLSVNALSEGVLPASVNTSTGQITVAGTYTTGEKVRLSSSGALPTGLAANTDYFAIYVDATHVRLATSRARALSGTYVTPSSQGTGTHTVTRLSRTVTAYQQDDVSSYVLGQSDGFTKFQEFNISRVGVLADTLAIVVNGEVYTQVDTLALSAATDKVYRLYYNTDGSCTVRFGDGACGAIPPAAAVYASYSYGGGSKSNVSYANQITNYAGGNPNVTGVFNPVPFTGGADEESIDSAKKNAPLKLKSRSRFITVEDGIALALAYGGLTLCAINRNVYGVLSCQVVGIATGGGNPSSALRSSIASYLASLTPLEGVFVQFDAATLTPVVISIGIHISSTYSWDNVRPYADIATKLFFSEAGSEVISAFLSGGISGAVAKINAIFSASFSSNDYVVIQSIVTAMQSLGTRNFGDYVAESDLKALLAATVIPGIDYVTITSCSPALPYQCSSSEITTVTGGSVTLTQV